MKMSRFTDDGLRAAFQFRAAGTPRPDLLHRIRQATRPIQQRPTLVVIRGTRFRRPILARLAAIAVVAVVLVGAGSGGRYGTDLLLGRPTPGGTPFAAADAIGDDEGNDGEDEGDDGEDESDDDDVDEELESD
ncbi:MAG: hypothetical protein ACRDE9_00135 [Candidatus Limnocylindria bacterium]